jgi:hypothetical protein
MTGYGAVASLLGSPTPGSPVMPTLVGWVRGAHALRGALGAVLLPPTRPGAMCCRADGDCATVLDPGKKGAASATPPGFFSPGDYVPGISIILIMSIVAPGICKNG